MNAVDKHLLSVSVKIPISSTKQSEQVQKTLFSLGCGYHDGTTLKQNIEQDWELIGLSVNPSGMMGCYVKDHDEEYYRLDEKPELSPDDVIGISQNG